MTKRQRARLTSRRQFVRRTSAVLALGAAMPGLAPLTAGLASTEPKTLIGSNVYGWTQYYQRDKKKFDVLEVLSTLGELGYDYLEGNLDVGNPDNNARFAEQMRARGLKPVSLYTGGRLHVAEQAKTAVQRILAAGRVCKEAGFQSISCNPDPIGREKAEPELATQAAALTDLGGGLRELGIHLGVHNHTPEMANHAREFHYNFRHTDPRLVGFCFDVHWVYRGGLAPLDALKEYGNRLVSWHVRQSRDGIWWEDLDTGDIDYAALAQYAKTHQLARLFTVELALEGGTKITRSAVENHRRSLAFVRRVFGL